MTPVPSSSQKPLKPILKRSPSSSVSKSVTFSATNSQVFFADDWDRSAVEVVSKLSYSDVLELKQLSLDSLPSDRHASMGLSPLLSHVPLTLCPLASEETKKSAAESRDAPPSAPASSPLVIPDLSILASPVSTASTIQGSPPHPPLSPVSSDAESSASVSLGSVSPHTSASSPESTPPKTNAPLTAPVPVRRTLMMNFMPLLPEPGSELPSPVLSASSSLSDDSTDTGKTMSLVVTPETPTTPRTPHTPSSLSPIPASPTSPTSFTTSSPQTQGPVANKSRTSRAEKARYSALSGPTSGDFGARSPTRSVGTASPVSPISPASDTTVSVASGPVVRPVPRRAYTPVSDVSALGSETALVRRSSISSTPGSAPEPVTRTKGSRGFDGSRTKRLAIASTAWVDGVSPVEPEPESTALVPVEPSLRAVALPAAAPKPPRPHHRPHSFSDSQPAAPKYINPYAQIRESDESQLVTESTRHHARHSSADKVISPPPVTGVKTVSVPPLSQYSEGSLGLSLKTSRPPPSMSRPVPTHRASVHGYPYGVGRPPSPTPQPFSRGYPSPLSPNAPLPQPQSQPQPRSGKPLAAKDANVRGSGAPGSGYTLAVDGGLGVKSAERKPRSANDILPPSPILAPYCAPMARPKNSKIGR